MEASRLRERLRTELKLEPSQWEAGAGAGPAPVHCHEIDCLVSCVEPAWHGRRGRGRVVDPWRCA